MFNLLKVFNKKRRLPATPPAPNNGSIPSLNVLLDDDLLIRMGWECAALEKNIPLKTFSSASDLMAVVNEFALDTRFYIDAVLSKNERGEEVAQKLYHLGFTELILATNYDKECFHHLDWLKGVQDKSPPF